MTQPPNDLILPGPGPLTPMDPMLIACGSCGCLLADAQLHIRVCPARAEQPTTDWGEQAVAFLASLDPDQLDADVIARADYGTSATQSMIAVLIDYITHGTA